MNIKINEFNLHVSFAQKFAHTNILQKRQLQQRKKENCPFANKIKSIPPKRKK